jgi:hypothetical protein
MDKVYRFKFSENFVENLSDFAKDNQYCDRHDFKERWSRWIEANEDLVSRENERLVSLGFSGDCRDKMFKSARYYYRNKSTAKTTPMVRREYVGLPKDVLRAIDNHILDGMAGKDYSPASGFDAFYDKEQTMITECVTIGDKLEGGSKSIYEKIKKTYKNRYYVNVSKLRKSMLERSDVEAIAEEKRINETQVVIYEPNLYNIQSNMS